MKTFYRIYKEDLSQAVFETKREAKAYILDQALNEMPINPRSYDRALTEAQAAYSIKEFQA